MFRDMGYFEKLAKQLRYLSKEAEARLKMMQDSFSGYFQDLKSYSLQLEPCVRDSLAYAACQALTEWKAFDTLNYFGLPKFDAENPNFLAELKKWFFN